MNFELTKYNINRIKKALEGVEGKCVYINGTYIDGVKSIEIEESDILNGDPDPETGDDGGKENLIIIYFNLESGRVSHSFRPDCEHCGITFETDDLWMFNIEDTKQYIERERSRLDFQIKEYEEYMAR